MGPAGLTTEEFIDYIAPRLDRIAPGEEYPDTADVCLLPAVCYLLSALCYLLSAICRLLPPLCPPPGAARRQVRRG
jgi:hypothetical protein